MAARNEKAATVVHGQLMAVVVVVMEEEEEASLGPTAQN